MTQFHTTAVYVSGGICGPIWWPAGQMCGKLLRQDLHRYPAWSKGDNFRDYLLSILTREGGDFQSASFTADTIIRIERRAVDAPGKYRVHVKELEIGSIPDCDDLVNQEAYTGDFMGDE